MSFQVLQADCKRAVSSLQDLSNDELDALMNDDEKLGNIISELDQSYLKEIENEKENLLATNNSMAEFNISREPELIEKREKLEELYQTGEELTKNVEEKTNEIRKLTGDMSLETALALLQTAASELEEESDKLAKKFLENEVDLEDFLDQFLEKRTLMHMRLAKAEKMAKIISRGGPLNSSNYMNSPPLSLNSNYFPGVPSSTPSSVPYPLGPLNMPMPSVNYFQNHY